MGRVKATRNAGILQKCLLDERNKTNTISKEEIKTIKIQIRTIIGDKRSTLSSSTLNIILQIYAYKNRSLILRYIKQTWFSHLLLNLLIFSFLSFFLSSFISSLDSLSSSFFLFLF